MGGVGLQQQQWVNLNSSRFPNDDVREDVFLCFTKKKSFKHVCRNSSCSDYTIQQLVLLQYCNLNVVYHP